MTDAYENIKHLPLLRLIKKSVIYAGIRYFTNVNITMTLTELDRFHKDTCNVRSKTNFNNTKYLILISQ